MLKFSTDEITLGLLSNEVFASSEKDLETIPILKFTRC